MEAAAGAAAGVEAAGTAAGVEAAAGGAVAAGTPGASGSMTGRTGQAYPEEQTSPVTPTGALGTGDMGPIVLTGGSTSLVAEASGDHSDVQLVGYKEGEVMVAGYRLPTDEEILKREEAGRRLANRLLDLLELETGHTEPDGLCFYWALLQTWRLQMATKLELDQDLRLLETSDVHMFRGAVGRHVLEHWEQYGTSIITSMKAAILCPNGTNPGVKASYKKMGGNMAAGSGRGMGDEVYKLLYKLEVNSSDTGLCTWWAFEGERKAAATLVCMPILCIGVGGNHDIQLFTPQLPMKENNYQMFFTHGGTQASTHVFQNMFNKDKGFVAMFNDGNHYSHTATLSAGGSFRFELDSSKATRLGFTTNSMSLGTPSLLKAWGLRKRILQK